MANRSPLSPESMSVDLDNLYREESYTDMQAASVRVPTPVTPEGTRDPDRACLYIGDTTLMTQMGPLPVQFPLEANSLQQALAAFPEGVRAAIERLSERARDMARDESSRIVVPSTKLPGGGGLPGGGLLGKRQPLLG